MLKPQNCDNVCQNLKFHTQRVCIAATSQLVKLENYTCIYGVKASTRIKVQVLNAGVCGSGEGDMETCLKSYRYFLIIFLML